MLIPRHGLVDQVTSVPYPRDPEDALGEMEESGIRYLREDDLRGDTAMEALRHDVLARPGSVNPEEWAALWEIGRASCREGGWVGGGAGAGTGEGERQKVGA